MSDLITGYRNTSQTPLDIKPYFATIADAADFGPENNLALSYYDGMFSYCYETRSFYVWSERGPLDERIGLLDDDFIYPSDIVTDQIDYSNKAYNFFVFAGGGNLNQKFSFSFTVILAGGKTFGKYTNGQLVEVVELSIPQIFQMIGQEVIEPTFIAPAFSITLSSYTQREVGSTYTALMTANFDKGQIKGKTVAGVWQENTKQDDRAGAVTGYTLDGTVEPINSKTVTRVLVPGNNVFTGSVDYLNGPQPLNSAGEDFDFPYMGGTKTDSKSIYSVYPVFYGTIASNETIDDIDLSTFTKLTTLNANNAISIPFSSIIGRKLVVLVPSEYTPKTKWYVTESNKGNIGGVGDLFAAPVNEEFESPTLLWTDKFYKVYISTPTSINTIMELRN